MEDLEEETLNINSGVSFSNQIIASYDAYEENFNKSDMGLLEIIYALATIKGDTFIPNFKTSTTETLKATGDIKLIPNEIRKKIIELSRSQEFLDHVIKRNANIYLSEGLELGKLGWSETMLRLLTNTNIARVTDTTFNDEEQVELIIGIESLYSFKYLINNIYIEKYEVMLKDIAHLKELIELEIKNN